MNTTSGIITLCYWPSGVQFEMELRLYQKFYSYNCPPEDEHKGARNM